MTKCSSVLSATRVSKSFEHSGFTWKFTTLSTRSNAQFVRKYLEPSGNSNNIRWATYFYIVKYIYVATPDDFRTLPVDCTQALLSLCVCVVLLPFSFLHAQQQRQRAAAYVLHLPFYIWQSIWTYGTVIKILISFCLFHPSLKIMLYMFYNLKSFRLKQQFSHLLVVPT